MTGCLVCGKSIDQVIEETFTEYLNQTAESGETVRERQIERNAFNDGIQSGVLTFLSPGVSEAAACDGLIYPVKNNRQNLGRQGYALPLSEDYIDKLSLNNLLDKFPPPSYYEIYLYVNIHTYIILRIFIYLDTYFITVQNPYQ